MASNIQKLGKQLAERMKKTAGAAVPVFAELGTINTNLSLTTDGLATPIPASDYMVPADITLASGNRVLVIWIGSNPVIANVY